MWHNGIMKNNKSGFTLIEMILYMALLGTLLVTIVYIFVAILDLKVNAQNTEMIQTDGKFMLSRMIYDINAASNVTTPSIGATGGEINMSICAAASSPNYDFKVVSGNLILTISGVQYQLNDSNATVSSFSVTRTTSTTTHKDTITVNFTLDSIAKNRLGTPISSVPFQTTINLI